MKSKRLKQEQNLKLENLQHKIDYLTNERDELQNQLTSMSFENDKLTKRIVHFLMRIII